MSSEAHCKNSFFVRPISSSNDSIPKPSSSLINWYKLGKQENRPLVIEVPPKIVKERLHKLNLSFIFNDSFHRNAGTVLVLLKAHTD